MWVLNEPGIFVVFEEEEQWIKVRLGKQYTSTTCKGA